MASFEDPFKDDGGNNDMESFENPFNDAGNNNVLKIDPDDMPDNIFQTPELVEKNGIFYYKKISLSENTIKLWNKFYYYDSPSQLIKLNYPAYTEDNYDYFPILGEEVENIKCIKACKIAQQKLKKIGYYHIDLYDDIIKKTPSTTKNFVSKTQTKTKKIVSKSQTIYNYSIKKTHNCTNVRKLDNDYFPIDMSKIFLLHNGGTQRRTKKRSYYLRRIKRGATKVR